MPTTRILQNARLPRILLNDEIDSDKTDQRPGQVKPPQQLDQSDEDRLGGYLVALRRLVRRDLPVEKQSRHHKKESDLDDEPGIGEAARNEMPDDNSCKPDQCRVEKRGTPPSHDWVQIDHNPTFVFGASMMPSNRHAL